MHQLMPVSEHGWCPQSHHCHYPSPVTEQPEVPSLVKSLLVVLLTLVVGAAIIGAVVLIVLAMLPGESLS